TGAPTTSTVRRPRRGRPGRAAPSRLSGRGSGPIPDDRDRTTGSGGPGRAGGGPSLGSGADASRRRHERFREAYSALTAATRFVSPSFASAKSIPVFGFVYSSLSMPA